MTTATGPLKNPRMIIPGNQIRFVYNGKLRLGTVEGVSRQYFTIRHTHPEHYGGKVYSNYSWHGVAGAISLL